MGSSKKVTIGYDYRIGMHMIIAFEIDEFQQIYVGEKLAWSGEQYSYVFDETTGIVDNTIISFSPLTASGTISIYKPSLFGGQKKEGGIIGLVGILFGDPAQVKDSYLEGLLGSSIPAYRGVVSVILYHTYVSSLTPYLKHWWFKVKRIPGKTWYSAKSDINGGANGAHVIRDIILSTDYGMGYTDTIFSDADFMAAADTLYDENLGISFVFAQQDSIENFIKEILNHINGVLYTSRETGKFVLKLVRDDYDSETIPSFDETNILNLELFERSAYGELINEVVIVYRPQGTKDDEVVTIQDLASIETQGAIISQTFQYPGLDTAESASRVGQRDLQIKSVPLARVRIRVNRKNGNLTLGDVFKFSWSKLGITDLIFRILSIDYGNIDEGQIIIDATQDVFSLPSTNYLSGQTSGFSSPSVAPSVATRKFFKESTYWELHETLDTGGFENLVDTSAFLSVFAGIQTYAAFSFELWTKVGSAIYVNADEASFSPYMVLSTDLNYTETDIPISVFAGSLESIALKTFGYLNDEIIRFDYANTVDGTVKIARGCLDTIPQEHSSGDVIYFCEDTMAIDETEYATSTTVDAKVLTKTSLGTLHLDDDTGVGTAMVGRFSKPYCPGNIKINTVLFPASVSNAITISWAHRDRTQQIVSILAFIDGSVGPEAGVTYNLKIYNETNALISDQSGLSVASFLYDLNQEFTDDGKLNKQLRVTLESIRGAITSYSKYDFTFARVVTPIWFDFISANVDLTSGNLTIEKNTASAVVAVSYSTTKVVQTGSGYCEITIDALNGNAIAIGTGSNPLINTLQNVLQGGSISSTDGTAGGSGVSFSDSDVIGIAFKNGKIWFRHNGTWINSGDPVAGTGEQISGITTPQYIQFVSDSDTNQPMITANFGATAFVDAAPTGFVSGWINS